VNQEKVAQKKHVCAACGRRINLSHAAKKVPRNCGGMQLRGSRSSGVVAEFEVERGRSRD
jgi:predicted RNA-binding Zn-ribbon protein involved in translation (DUF1610 family)